MPTKREPCSRTAHCQEHPVLLSFLQQIVNNIFYRWFTTDDDSLQKSGLIVAIIAQRDAGCNTSPGSKKDARLRHERCF